jgi:peptidyl-prolyl cis-trans isomerase A (cyclophilin A)
MNRRLLICAALLLLSPQPALAQDAASPVVAPAAHRAELETPLGVIVIELDARAPVTSANFMRYVDEGRFDGVAFYRSMNLGAAGGLIQGGAGGAHDRILPPIAHEPTSQTGLAHVDGAVAMARFEPGSATGDFFIIVGSGMGSLNAGPADPGFAVFGRVVEGMEVVRAILAAPRSPTAGEGVMVGQMLEPKITITDARRAD